MFTLFRQRTIYVFTILTLFSQLVFANPNFMMPKVGNLAHSDNVISSETNGIHDRQLAPTLLTACSSANHLHETLSNNKAHHCDCITPCSSDCDNWFYINIADTLLMHDPWQISHHPDNKIVSLTPYFQSILPTQHLRPPIA